MNWQMWNRIGDGLDQFPCNPALLQIVQEHEVLWLPTGCQGAHPTGDVDERAENISVLGSIGIEDPLRYDVKPNMAPRKFLDSKHRSFSQGTAVGRGILINKLVWTWGSEPDFDA
ncbi:uncharacterized protein GGS25DRAFT_522873 [Hypoxylon fragiforme]|uniref:uncharacterized protein n=1 Tax=Hypoxylon fragiforme TaxID=63214 RepID=UPI0020C73CAC|nr:uncharacterized protein GGS25DRAFT_522873 [Hypoxylon fragiforme]KAI2607350.1 hypothetical protein GGS25DRAFT_522873 [Hypoxylon fragiforme]